MPTDTNDVSDDAKLVDLGKYARTSIGESIHLGINREVVTDGPSLEVLRLMALDVVNDFISKCPSQNVNHLTVEFKVTT